MMVGWLFSYCHCNELPLNWWLQATQIYYFTYLKIRSLKHMSLGWNQDMGRTMFLLKTLGENTFFLSFLVCRGHLKSWLVTSFFKAGNRITLTSSASTVISLWLLSSFTYKGLLWKHGTRLDIPEHSQANLALSSSAASVSSSVSQHTHGFQGLGWGHLFCLPQ